MGKGNIFFLLFFPLFLSGCVLIPEKKVIFKERYFEKGYASWYGSEFHGKKTASGEIYNKNAMTGAHKTLPFGTKVKVTRVDNGKSVIIRINDRGPFRKGFIVDLSEAAAKKLGIKTKALVTLEILD